MRGITGEQDTAFAPIVGDTSMKMINSAAPILERAGIDKTRHALLDLVERR